MIGTTLSHYKILGVLGAGGMGVVYLAEDERLGRQVAVKFLPANAVQDQLALDRFRLEARTAGSLSHPGICAIYDIGVHEEAPYIVMELLKGETLRERVARKPFKIADVLDVGIQLADALGAAHERGVVHRDVKPANIFVGEKLRARILDFGLAKLAREKSPLTTGTPQDVTVASEAPYIENQLTTPGMAIGTVSYMSPEQARGEDVDSRTDIFSLGVVLYEMVTGRLAFGGSTSAVVFDAILNRAPISPILFNPDTPQRLVDAINTALEKDRDLRYQHAEDLEADLKRIRRDLQSGTTTSATHTVAVAVANGTSQPGSGGSAAATAVTVAGVPAVPSSSTTTGAVPGATSRHMGPVWAALTAVAVVGVAWLGGFGRSAPPPPPNPFSATEQVGRALARLEARDYRTALAEASAALARDPQNADAVRVQAVAETQLAALDRVIAAAKQALSGGDSVGAARHLAEAQALAPADALVAELSALVRAGSTAPAEPPAEEPPVARAAPTQETRTAQARAARTQPPPATPERQSPVAPPVTVPAPEPARPPVAPATEARPAVSTPAPSQEPPAAAPTAVTPAAPAPAPPPLAPAPPVPDSDDVVIRRVVSTYERSIESKDLALFRSVRPGLSADEERRLRAAFEQVGSHQIDITIESLAITGDTAVVRLARRDVVDVNGRSQTTRATQTLRLSRRGTGWIIVELSR